MRMLIAVLHAPIAAEVRSVPKGGECEGYDWSLCRAPLGGSARPAPNEGLGKVPLGSSSLQDVDGGRPEEVRSAAMSSDNGLSDLALRRCSAVPSPMLTGVGQ